MTISPNSSHSVLRVTGVNTSRSPAIKSSFGTCHTRPSWYSATPPVNITGRTSHPGLSATTISTTGIPTPVASTASRFFPASPGFPATSATRLATFKYGVPNSIRSKCPVRQST